jgi:hypothetical protein
MKPSLDTLGVVALAIALAFPACATMEVNSYVASRSPDASARTYDWGYAPVQPTGDPRLDNNEFFEARVRTAVERQLALRGWRKSEAPVVLVHYHTSVVQDLTFLGADTATGYCADCRPEVYDSGTLLIDIVRAGDQRLIWRGWAKGNVSGLVDNQKWLDERVDRAITEIFATWPAAF